MQKFNETELLKIQLLDYASQIQKPSAIQMAYGFCRHLAESEEQKSNSQAQELQELRTDYKNGIMEVLKYIPDSDSVFLRQLLIILLRHAAKKGGASHE